MSNSGLLELIGSTPLVELRALAEESTAKVFAKLEYLNPSGSIKDRIALRMIEDAELRGALRPGFAILESSTGNTGIAISFVGAVRRYKVIIYETTPGGIGTDKVRIMQRYGAEVRSLRPEDSEETGEGSVAGAEVELPGRQLCLELEKSNSQCWWARQFSNPWNTLAHHQTGEEILAQTNGRVDVFVASIGTGGTLKGIAEVLKDANPNVKIVGIQPASSKMAIVPGVPYPASEVDGGIISEMVVVPSLIDDVVRVKDEEAVEFAHHVWAAGFFAGVSSGANALVALREARRMPRGNVVTVFPDSGDRYLTEEHYVT
jgi:cysteine synthase A